MKLQKKTKGYLLALVATLAMANVYVFSKAALNELSLYQFGFYWFGYAIIWNLMYAVPTGKVKAISRLGRKELLVLSLLGILELAATSLFFISIEKTTDPALMSFLQNLVPLFVIIMGVIFLSERFTGFQILGVVITLGGAVITSFTGSIKESGLFIQGTGYMIGSAAVLAVITIISKRYIKRLDPGMLSLNRAVYIFILALLLLLIKGESVVISRSAMINVLIGSMVGPFLTALANYSALKYIEASKTTLVQSTKGVFVLAGAWIYFHTVPEGFQVAGGIVTIVGVIVLIAARDINS